jgi:hypothetical protein
LGHRSWSVFTISAVSWLGAADHRPDVRPIEQVRPRLPWTTNRSLHDAYARAGVSPVRSSIPSGRAPRGRRASGSFLDTWISSSALSRPMGGMQGLYRAAGLRRTAEASAI